MRRVHKVLATCFFLSVGGDTLAQNVTSDSECGQNVVDRVASFYGNLKEYEDEGSVRTQSGQTYSFETKFTSKDYLEFVYKDDVPSGETDTLRLVVDDGEAWKFYGKGGVFRKERGKDPYSMLFSFVGLTHGTSLEVPILLLGINNIFSDGPPPDAIMEDSANMCMVSFTTAAGRTLVYWIDDTGVIRKYVEETPQGARREVVFEDIRFALK